MKNILYTIILSFLFSSSVFADWNSKFLKEVHDGCTTTDEKTYDIFGGKNRLILYCDCSTYNLSQTFTVSEVVRLMEFGEMESNDKLDRVVDYCIKLLE
jgi:hypothetical protein